MLHTCLFRMPFVQNIIFWLGQISEHRIVLSYLWQKVATEQGLFCCLRAAQMEYGLGCRVMPSLGVTVGTVPGGKWRWNLCSKVVKKRNISIRASCSPRHWRRPAKKKDKTLCFRPLTETEFFSCLIGCAWSCLCQIVGEKTHIA